MAFNILQASYAIYSPRKPHAPTSTPAKSLPLLQSPRATPSAPAWRSKSHGLSPNVRICLYFAINIHAVLNIDFDSRCSQTTPQRQKAFTPSASYTPSDPLNLARSYTLSFSGPSPDASFASSASLPPSPSPLTAYRGRQGGAIGREFIFVVCILFILAFLFLSFNAFNPSICIGNSLCLHSEPV